MQEDNGYRIHHQVQLPGGKHIEVVYLDGRDAPVERSVEEALHVCPSCGGGLAHPLDWFEESPGRWRLLMRCPDCQLLREGTFGEALIERLDDELDRAMASMLDDLKRITHANMAEEIELFSRALELDLIGPSDF